MIRLNNTTYTYIFTYNNSIKPRNFIDINETTEATQEINSIYALVKEKYIVLNNTDNEKLQSEYNKRNGGSFVGDAYTKDEIDEKLTNISLVLNTPLQVNVQLSKVNKEGYGIVSNYFNNGDTGYVYISGENTKGELHLDAYIEYVATNTFTKIESDDIVLTNKNNIVKIPVELNTTVDTPIKIYVLPKGETYKGDAVGMTMDDNTLFNIPKVPTSMTTFESTMHLNNPSYDTGFNYQFDVPYSGKDITFECDVEGVTVSVSNSDGKNNLNNIYYISINSSMPDLTEFTVTINIDGLSVETGTIIMNTGSGEAS